MSDHSQALETSAPEEALTSPSLDSLDQIDTPSCFDAWLELAVRKLPGICSAILAVDELSSGRLSPVCFWPVDIQNAEVLGDLIDQCVLEDHSVVMPLGAPDAFGLAFPVKQDGVIRAVFAAQFRLNSPDKVEQAMDQVEWLCLWLKKSFAQQRLSEQQEQLQRLNLSFDGYQAVSSAEAWNEAALSWVDGLQKHFACERVSVSSVRKGRVHDIVISGSSDHEHKSLLVKSIKSAMQEAVDQASSICLPRVESREYLVTQNCEKLSQLNQNGSLLVMPLVWDDEIYAVVLLERTADKMFDHLELGFIESVTNLVGRALDAKRLASQSAFSFIRAKAKTQLERLLRPGYIKRKLFALASIALVLFLCFASGEYSVNGNAELEPRMVRVVSAPFDGYLKSAPVRAGQLLEQNDVLLSLEDRDLRLEKIKWISQVAQEEKQYNEALASYDRAQANILAAKIAQSEAALDAVNSKLDRSTVRVPFDALVLSGDLSKRVGGAIGKGEELFQVSPLDDYRLIIEVSEYKIQDLEVGQKGHVLFSSIVDQDYPIRVESITPVTSTKEGSTYYRVEASLDVLESKFRPGLVGVARIAVDERLYIDIWTHDFRKWLSLQLWSFWG